MTKFDPQQAADVLAVQQLVNEWATELDRNNGLKIADLLTEDCRYNVGGEWREGRAETVKFYVERMPRLAATPQGVPVMRHVLCNPRVSFSSATEAAIAFGLVFFSSGAIHMGLKPADPLAIADVDMTARKEADGHWRLSSFDSVQTLTRA